MPTRRAATMTPAGQGIMTPLQPFPLAGLFDLPPLAPPPPAPPAPEPKPAPLFDAGRVVATPGALALLDGLPQIDGKDRVIHLLNRHLSGDWGNLDECDARANTRALKTGERLLSSYKADGSMVWIITEADRSSTCVMLPEEY